MLRVGRVKYIQAGDDSADDSELRGASSTRCAYS
jgi:hypothetical protein